MSRLRPTRERTGPYDPERVIEVAGFDVHVNEAGRSVMVERDGRDTLLPLEEYRQMVAERLVDEAPDLDALRRRWLEPSQRKALLSNLPGGERSASLLQQLDRLTDCDLYDVLAQEAYGAAPKTKRERADAILYKHGAWLKALPPRAAALVKALAEQFAKGGIAELEKVQVFDTPEVRRAGGVEALAGLGDDAPSVLRTAKEKLLAA